MDNTSITSLCDSSEFWKNISVLSFSGSRMNQLCDAFVNTLVSSRKIKLLDIKNSQLSHISKTFEDFKFIQEIWLSGNPFHCDCEMIWMMQWLNNSSKSASQQHVVMDYKEMKCHTGMMTGKLIYQLNEIEMGCYPFKWTLWQKISVGTGIAIVLLIIITVVLVVRKNKLFSFLMYYYLSLNTIPKDDKNENVNGLEFDAYFSFW